MSYRAVGYGKIENVRSGIQGQGCILGDKENRYNIGSMQRILSNRAAPSLEKFERQGGIYIILLDYLKNAFVRIQIEGYLMDPEFCCFTACRFNNF